MLFIQDINGDGKDELIFATEDGNPKKYYTFQFYSMSNTFNSPFSIASVSDFCNVGFGDFDGNGSQDIYFLRLLDRVWYFNFYKIESNTPVSMGDLGNFETVNINSNVIDANGNGKKDIEVKVSNLNETTIYEYDGSDFQLLNLTNPIPHLLEWKWYGDVNGDGITDILAWHKDSGGTGHLSLFIATGSGTFIQNDLSDALNAVRNSPYDEPKYKNIMFLDLNGDGKEDIIQGVYENGNTTFNILLSKGCVNEEYLF
jgi:hypothetical protein